MCITVPDVADETTAAKDNTTEYLASALMHAVAQADALLQTSGEELRQQAGALEGYLTAAGELRMQNKYSDMALSSHITSTTQAGGQSTGEAGEAPKFPVELLCCLTALRTWSAELKLRSLHRAAFGAHLLLFLLTNAPPNPNSAAATAATTAVSTAAQSAVGGAVCGSGDVAANFQHVDQPTTRRSSRQHIQLTSVGETVISAHTLSSHIVMDGITQALEFFFEPQHYEALYSAGLSLQGAASALLLAEAVIRRRMQQYRSSGSSASSKQKLPLCTDLKDGNLAPLPDKQPIQQCCNCLLLCMGRYQDYLYKSPIAVSL